MGGVGSGSNHAPWILWAAAKRSSKLMRFYSIRNCNLLNLKGNGNTPTDADELNPIGMEIWYRMTRRFSILDGIEANPVGA